MTDQFGLPAVAQVHCEEGNSTGDVVATIGHYGGCYPVMRFAPYGLRLLEHPFTSACRTHRQSTPLR